ncbi:MULTISPECIES: hypothetical protein [Bacillus cereus group]|uniref:hypothetical protein n=1 Tax=Bacillus cereus group TaxID=86661 RepID=UPI00397D3E22
MKKPKNYRIEEEQIQQLESLVEIYKQNNAFIGTVNNTSILEFLIKQEYLKQTTGGAN